ncbi:hypothetical protein [Oceanomicrobium pacificus]|uniref:Alpha/beta hydrolase n=1 Tax=Oceanomicrobium pacificus TaxID=2692916 RepID=A0A6B0TV30_9RHOB|nr:hypothetical protein [Oceanomicrobium pacificus]MXU65458.1 hypothetical protein [Oceanomicrobium pacificus]
MIGSLQSLGLGIVIVMATMLMIALLSSPFESMFWWSRRQRRDALPEPHPLAEPPRNPPAVVIYLSGIGTLAGDAHPRSERKFLRRLEGRIAPALLLSEVFPYSAKGVPLNGERLFNWLWEAQGRIKARDGFGAFGVNLRNLFQVLVSADRRYGPIYSAGVADLVLAQLRANGIGPDYRGPLIFVGYSGGAQVSVGMAPFLRAHVAGPMYLLTLGGVISSDHGLTELEEVIDFRGPKDRVVTYGAVGFVPRWPIFRNSDWNIARRAGKFETRTLDGMGHNGRGGYLDRLARDKAGRSNLERTVEAIATEVDEITRRAPSGPTAPAAGGVQDAEGPA